LQTGVPLNLSGPGILGFAKAVAHKQFAKRFDVPRLGFSNMAERLYFAEVGKHLFVGFYGVVLVVEGFVERPDSAIVRSFMS